MKWSATRLPALLFAALSMGCINTEFSRAPMDKGNYAVRVGSIVSNSRSNTLDVKSQELQIEYALAKKYTLILGVGQTDYQYSGEEKFSAEHFALIGRRYTQPVRNFHPYWSLGLRRSRFPMGDTFLDFDTGGGVLYQYKNWQLDLQFTSAIYTHSGGNLIDDLFSTNRHKGLVLFGVGYSF